jgi:hypothetical protein
VTAAAARTVAGATLAAGAILLGGAARADVAPPEPPVGAPLRVALVLGTYYLLTVLCEYAVLRALWARRLAWEGPARGRLLATVVLVNAVTYPLLALALSLADGAGLSAPLAIAVAEAIPFAAEPTLFVGLLAWSVRRGALRAAPGRGRIVLGSLLANATSLAAGLLLAWGSAALFD